jgi:hypothetical protein
VPAAYTERRMLRVFLVVLLTVAVTGFASASGAKSPDEVRPRVDHHLKEVEALAQHFETVLNASCPRFASPAEWDRYLDSEVERVEQAWVEAKTTGDDELRRVAKAPRKRLDQARLLLGKLSGCADANGSPLNQGGLWRRIEREVPQRQIEIALPQ